MIGHGAKLPRKRQQAIAALIEAPTIKEAAGIVGIGEVLSGQGIEQAVKSVERVKTEGPSTVLGERVLEATGSPELATIAHSLPTAALEVIGVKGLRSAKLSLVSRLCKQPRITHKYHNII